MKKIIGLFIILIAIVLTIKFSDQIKLNFFQKNPIASINNKSFNLIIAKSLKEKQIGLSDRKSLDTNTGMLFPFEKADFYPFWMKDMKFPIDILFIKDNKIISLFENVQPPKDGQAPEIIRPQSPADKVLEINAGLSQKYKIEKGNEVSFKNL